MAFVTPVVEHWLERKGEESTIYLFLNITSRPNQELYKWFFFFQFSVGALNFMRHKMVSLELMIIISIPQLFSTSVTACVIIQIMAIKPHDM